MKTIPQNYPYGIKDQHVLRIALQEQRILLTNDKDYGELIFHHRFPHSGVILFRLKRGNIDIHARTERLQVVLEAYTEQLHHFIVITEERIRVRKQDLQQAA